MKSTCSFRLRLALVGTLVLVGLALFSASVLATEYVVNGGFESGLDLWSVGGDRERGYSTVSDKFHSGGLSLLITTSYGNVNAYQVLSLTQGVAYTLSLWSFGDGLHPMTVRLMGDPDDLCSYDVSPLVGWSLSECSFTNTQSSPEVVLIFILGDYTFEGSGYIDDVSISDGVSAPIPTPVSSSQWTVVTGTLPSGNVYAVEYKVTAGDIFVGVVAFIFLVIAIVVRKL
jgi:hypothetical protein